MQRSRCSVPVLYTKSNFTGPLMQSRYPANPCMQIVSIPDTVGGSPRIEGSRWTCANVVGAMWYNHYNIARFLTEYETNFYEDDVVTCLRYCAVKQCIFDRVHSHCEHCTLDVGWGQHMAMENEAAIRNGLPPPKRAARKLPGVCPTTLEQPC